MILRSAAVVSALLAAVVGCGLRSDPISMTGTVGVVGDGTAPDEGDPGTCTNPFVLESLADSSISGMLSGEGNYAGWCGGDGGREDVYLFEAVENVDVTIEFDPAMTDDVTVRVLVGEASCQNGSRSASRMCDRTVIESGDSDTRTFFALAPNRYYIVVDSKSVEPAAYEATISVDPPELGVCDPHPDAIVQSSGSTFTWFNDFAEGHGRVDGPCGGPGKENMFRLDASYPGSAFIEAFGSGGFDPVVGVRRGCGGTTEFACTSAQEAGTPGRASLSVFLPEPGQYWLTVDSNTIDVGSYSLEVTFD